MKVKVKNNLKFYRREKQITQKELGILTDISERQIQSYEANSSTPNGTNMLRLAKFFNIPVEELFKLSGKNNS